MSRRMEFKCDACPAMLYGRDIKQGVEPSPVMNPGFSLPEGWTDAAIILSGFDSPYEKQDMERHMLLCGSCRSTIALSIRATALVDD